MEKTLLGKMWSYVEQQSMREDVVSPESCQPGDLLASRCGSVYRVEVLLLVVYLDRESVVKLPS